MGDKNRIQNGKCSYTKGPFQYKDATLPANPVLKKRRPTGRLFFNKLSKPIRYSTSRSYRNRSQVSKRAKSFVQRNNGEQRWKNAGIPQSRAQDERDCGIPVCRLNHRMGLGDTAPFGQRPKRQQQPAISRLRSLPLNLAGR